MRSSTSLSYLRLASPSALLAGVSGILYSISSAFIARADSTVGAGLSGLFLMLGGLLGATALLGLYERLRDSAGDYALWALLFGLAGSLAATMHGGYDLANSLHPPGVASQLPSPVDPRGLGTLGLMGVSLLIFARLMRRDGRFGTRLPSVGYLSGVLLILSYVVRLIVLNPSSPLVFVLAAVEGFLVNPLWYVLLSRALRQLA